MKPSAFTPSAVARRLAPLALVLAAACSSSEGHFSVCGVSPSITAPEARAAFVPEPRFHGTPTADTLWREHVVEEVAALRADTVVRLLFVHATSVVADDRDRVTAAGGTIVEEPHDWNGIVATFTVAQLRAYVPTAPIDRVIDGHVVTTRVLPPCD